MAVDFRAIIDNLVGIGFYSVVLPFLLVYAIVFAILEKSKIFNKGGKEEGSETKNVNAIIAFVFGLFVVASIQTVQYIQSLILNVVLIIIFLLVVLILLGFIFGDSYMKFFVDEKGNITKWVGYGIGGLIFIVALGVLFSILGVWDAVWNWFDDLSSSSGDFGTYFVLILLGLVLYWISKDSKGNSGSGGGEN